MKQTLKLADFEGIYIPYRASLGYYSNWIVLSEVAEEGAGELIPATRLLDPVFLREKITDFGQSIGTTDLKVAASMWSKYFNITLLPLALSLLTLGGVGFDFSLENLSCILTSPKEGSRPARFIPHQLTHTVIYPNRCETSSVIKNIAERVNSVNELHEMVFRGLFKQNMALLVDTLHEATGISKKVVWGNAGTFIFGIYQLLGQELKTQASEEDHLALLEHHYNHSIATGRNPLYQPVKLKPSDNPNSTEPAYIRTTCCLWYKTPQGYPCNDCPLPNCKK